MPFDPNAALGTTPAPSPDQTTPAPSTGGSGGGFDVNAALGGSAPVELAAPQQAAASGGGGGLSGFLGRAAGDVVSAAKGLGPGIESMALAAPRLGRSIGEYGYEKATGEQISNEAAQAPGFVNTIAHVFSGGKLGDYGQLTLEGGTPAAYASNQNNFFGGVAKGFEQTGREIAHPTQAVRNYSQHPIASLLNDAANVSIVGGGVGEALKGAEAGSVAARVGAAAGKVGEVAGRVANPAGEALGAAKESLAGSAVGQALQKQVTAAKARAAVASLKQETLGTVAADIRQSVGTRVQELNKLVPDRTEQGSAALLAQGLVDAPGAAQKLDAALVDPTSGPVIEESLKNYNDALTARYGAAKAQDLAVTPEMVRQAVDARLGTLPADQSARLAQGEKFYRDLGTQHRTLAQAAGLSEEALKGTPNPLTGPVAEKAAPAAQRVTNLTEQRDALQQRVEDLGIVRPGQSLADARTEQLQNAAALRRRAKSEEAKFGTVSDATRGAVARAEEQANVVDRYARTQPLVDKAQQRFSEVSEKAGDLIEAAPSAYRPTLMHWRDFTTTLSAAADKAATDGDPIAAEKLAGVSKDFGEFGKLTSFQNPLGPREAFIANEASLRPGDVDPAEVRLDAIKAGAPQTGDPGATKTVPFESGTVQGVPGGHAIVHYGADGAIDGSLIVTDAGLTIGVHPDATGQGVGSTLMQAASRAGYDVTAMSRAGGMTPEGAALTHKVAEPTQPSYFRGGAAREKLPAAPTALSAREVRPGFTKAKTTNITETNFRGQFIKHIEDWTTYARGQFAQELASRFGIKASEDETASQMAFGEMKNEMQGRGLVPWDPHSGTVSMGSPSINHDTVWLTPEMAKAADAQLTGDFAKGAAGTLFDKLTQATYRDWLKLSPFYMAHMIGSDAALALTHGMSVGDIINYGHQAMQLLASPESRIGKLVGATDEMAPGSLLGSKIDDADLRLEKNAPGPLGRAKQAYATATSIPKTVDELTRVAMYLKNMDDLGMSHEQAVSEANRVLGHLNTLGPVEKNIISRIFPVYPWMKQVATVSAKLAKDHPVAALWTLNAGEFASQRNEQGLPTFLQGFDPARLLSINPLNLVNPIVRAGAGAGLGLNLASHRMVTENNRKAGRIGPMGARGAEYFAAHQFPLGKLVEPLTHTPNMRRNDAGQLVFKGGQPEKSAYPDNFPDALKTFLFGANFGAKPAPTSTLGRAQAKAKTTASKAAVKLGREQKQARQRGVT